MHQKKFLTDLANLAESMLRNAEQGISPDEDPAGVLMRRVAKVDKRNESLSSCFEVQESEIEKILRPAPKRWWKNIEFVPPPVMH